MTPTVEFSTLSSSPSEGDSSVTILVELDVTDPLDVTVPFTIGGTAVAIDDYSSPASPIIIPAGQLSAELTITLVDDLLHEADETIELTLSTPTNAALGAATLHTVTIVDDDDAPTVEFALGVSSPTEADGNVLVTVELSAVSNSDVSLPFTVAGTAVDPDDYGISASPLVIPAGSLTADIAIALVDDGIDEPDETVELTLGAPTGATLGAAALHTVTIGDDDLAPTVKFVLSASSPSEADRNVLVSVGISTPSGSDVSLPFTVAGTAVDPDDYGISASPLVIPAGSLTADIAIALIDDGFDEPDETIELTLGVPTGATLGNEALHTVTIVDDDEAPTVEFALSASSLTEADGNVLVTVGLSAVSESDVSLPFTAAGTAVDPDDYGISASPLVIPAGSLTADIAIALVDDLLNEPDETVELTLGIPAAGATLGANSVHVLTILDDEPLPTVEFALANSEIVESGSSAMVLVQLSTPLMIDLAIDFDLTGTAVAGSDYTATPSPISIPAGQVEATLEILPIDDAEIEGNEWIGIGLVPNVDVSLGGNASHSLTLRDDELTLNFAATSANALETDGVILVGVTLTNPYPADILVPLTLGGTASEGEDVTVTMTEILIPSGLLTANYEIQIVDDAIPEPDETLILTLGSPDNGALGAASEFTLIIEDDDTGQVDIHEFMASNSVTLLDEDGDSSDWIEINNSLTVAVDLTGWHLTDNSSSLDKWTFPATTLMPGEFLVVFASDKDRALSGQELHTNFRLSASGEYLALTDATNAVVFEYAPEYPNQSTDTSYGLLEGTLTQSYFSTPTPGAPNALLGEPLEPVVFSVQHGYYDAPQTLGLSHPTGGAEIRYTLDGSRPSVEDGLLYSEPLEVDGTTIVRASAFADGFAPSIPVTQTYLFYGDVFEQTHAGAISSGFPSAWIDLDGVPWTAASEGTHPGAWYGLYETFVQPLGAVERRDLLDEIPSVSLTMPIDDWLGFDPAEGIFGIYANSLSTGDLFDRNASIEWIDPAGGPEFSDGVQLSIQGNGSTRPQGRSQLSIAMRFRSNEGSEMLDFPAFEDSNVEEFEYLLLDGGSQGSINEITDYADKLRAQGGLRDFFSTELGRAAGFPEAHSRFVHVYINGLHWGVYLLHERPDDNYGSTHFGGDPDEWDNLRHGRIRNGNTNPADHPTAPGLWPTVLDIAAGGVAPGDIWQGQPAYEALAARVDLKSYVSYIARNFYVGNRDWSGSNWLTIAHARLSGDLTDVNPDARFEFYSWDAENTLQANQFADLVDDGVWDRSDVTSTNEEHVLFLHTALIENPEYRILFADEAWRLVRPGGPLYVDPDFAAFGTPFDPDFPERNRPAALYYALSLELEPAVAMEYARWGHYGETTPPVQLSDWQAERQRLLEEYFPIRTGVFLQQLRSGAVVLMSDLDAPTFSQQGGSTPLGTEIALSGSPSAQILYTLDGTDPRAVGGAVSTSAILYTGPIVLDQPSVHLCARQLQGSDWSPIDCNSFFAGGRRLVINEFSADNLSTIFDEAGEADDWIEIFNRAPHAVDLSGWGLSDDPSNPGKWTFPEGTLIGSKDNLLVWADRDLDQGPLHADFSLSKNGEEVVLSLPAELGFETVDSTIYGAVQEDLSRGRIPNANGPFVTLQRPTPGLANALADQANVQDF